MSAVAIMCQCCKDECGTVLAFDRQLGRLCEDCADGIRISTPHLNRLGMVGIYLGPCPDNGKELS